MKKHVRPTYDIVLDKTLQGVLVCNVMKVMRPPTCLYTFHARPEGEKYRLYRILPGTDEINNGLVDNEAMAKSNLVRIAQQYALRHVTIRAGGSR